MATDAQNAYMADTFGVDPATYPASNDTSGDAPASGDDAAASPTTASSEAVAAPAQNSDTAATAQPAAAATDAAAVVPVAAVSNTDASKQDSDAAAEKPTLSVKSNGDGTFTLSGSDFVGNTAYIRAVGTGAKDYAYGQAWGSVPVSGGSFSATTPDVCGTEGGDRFFSANDGRPDASDLTGTLWSNTVKVSCPNAGGGSDPGDDPGADPADPGAGDKGDGSAGGDAAPSGDQGAAAGASDTSADTASAPVGTQAADTATVLPVAAVSNTDASKQDSDAAAEKPTLSVKSNGDGTFTLSGSGFVGNTAYIRAVGTGAKDYAYGQAWGSVPVSGGSFSATTPDVCGTEGGDRFFSANDGRPDASDLTGTLWSNTVKVSCPNAGGGGGGDDPGNDPPDPAPADPVPADLGPADPGAGDPSAATSGQPMAAVQAVAPTNKDAGALDAGTPADAGARGDSGAPPPDAGAPPPDAGAPSPDAGAPPPDAGAPPPAAGAPPPDAGAPPPDAGAPPAKPASPAGKSTVLTFPTPKGAQPHSDPEAEHLYELDLDAVRTLAATKGGNVPPDPQFTLKITKQVEIWAKASAGQKPTWTFKILGDPSVSLQTGKNFKVNEQFAVNLVNIVWDSHWLPPTELSLQANGSIFLDQQIGKQIELKQPLMSEVSLVVDGTFDYGKGPGSGVTNWAVTSGLEFKLGSWGKK